VRHALRQVLQAARRANFDHNAIADQHGSIGDRLQIVERGPAARLLWSA